MTLTKASADFCTTRTCNPNHVWHACKEHLLYFTILSIPISICFLETQISLHHRYAPSFWSFPDQSGIEWILLLHLRIISVLETSASIKILDHTWPTYTLCSLVPSNPLGSPKQLSHLGGFHWVSSKLKKTWVSLKEEGIPKSHGFSSVSSCFPAKVPDLRASSPRYQGGKQQPWSMGPSVCGFSSDQGANLPTSNYWK